MSLSASQARALERNIANNLTDHLTPDDITGAIRDILGSPVTKADETSYQHFKEVTEALAGVENGVKTLAGSLTKEVDQATRTYISRVIGEAQAAVDKVNQALDAARAVRNKENEITQGIP